MMDFHSLIIISCLFLASLLSYLFINKFFRRKTFEEIIAEKKAMTEKIYGQTKSAAKKPKKLQLKKDTKREKKLRQKEHQKDNAEQEESDAQSEQVSVEEEPQGLSKTHVEFEPDPEVMNNNVETYRRASNAEKETHAGNATKQKSKKDKKGGGAKAGILVNKHEPVAVKENLAVDEATNHFEVKTPKDSFELKKHEKEREKEKEKDKKDDKQQNKKEKSAKKDKHLAEKHVVEPQVEVVHVAAKESKQQDEKVRQGSPKNQHNGNTNNTTKSGKQQNKKQNKETAATKELVNALDKLSDTDTIGVSLLMNLFRRAELNRSEIQILIDYLLNKQQDMPSTHSEWSDDICQKLKRQLEEKERALAEANVASIGFQAKLRDLRIEINAERAQITATVKAYLEKIQAKEQEIAGLNQEMQTLNEKIAQERQQFQAKLLREKQAGTQDLLAQLQIMQNELAHKDKCIADLTHLMNASRQAVEESQKKNDFIQTQAQQIRALEQQREELEQVSNNRIFELENAKTLETENAEIKVELRNLQNTLDQMVKEANTVRAELTHEHSIELAEKQKELQILQAKNDELAQQITGITSKTAEQTKEQSGLQVTLDAVKQQLAEKEKQLMEFNAKNAELLQKLSAVDADTQQQKQQQQEMQKIVLALQADVASKHKHLQEVEEHVERFNSTEKELLQQLQEQKEKNNDLRNKNWKLIAALQNAETTIIQNKMLSNSNENLVQQQQLLAATQHKPSAASTSSSGKDEQKVRELFQRLYPEAVKACSGTALSASFDQWVEQVLSMLVKQAAATATKNASNNNSSNKSTQSNSTNTSTSSTGDSESSSKNNSTHNSHNDNNLLNSESSNNTSSSRINNNSNFSSSDNTAEMQKLHTENAQLRAKNDELTKLVTKTSNTLSELESHAREQDDHYNRLLSSKDKQIDSLKHSNGEQAI